MAAAGEKAVVQSEHEASRNASRPLSVSSEAEMEPVVSHWCPRENVGVGAALTIEQARLGTRPLKFYKATSLRSKLLKDQGTKGELRSWLLAIAELVGSIVEDQQGSPMRTCRKHVA